MSFLIMMSNAKNSCCIKYVGSTFLPDPIQFRVSGIRIRRHYEKGLIIRAYFSMPSNQWRSQTNNLVPLGKFQIVIIIYFVRN